MGGGESVPRRVTFEADENDNITVVKGIRLSENVIERMKEPSSPGGKSQKKFGASNHTSIEELKKRIAEELALEQARLKENQSSVQDELAKALDRERAASSEHLARAVLRERASAEDERMKSQLLVSGTVLPKIMRLQKNFKEQTEYYKIWGLFYQCPVHLRFVSPSSRRYKADPLCVDLQNQIFRCYQQNPKETLSCSALATEYFKCVQHARQVGAKVERSWPVGIAMG
uniref:Coiled-coil-helix-coiled-coil-helix domain containing 3 n=1 Tax=Naja naja TaxID=35670 RepID=A0A8C6XI09_NAJNA